MRKQVTLEKPAIITTLRDYETKSKPNYVNHFCNNTEGIRTFNDETKYRGGYYTLDIYI